MTRQTYRALLLRLWRVDSGGRATWRASLEDAHSGERHGFSDLPALHGFLQALLDAPEHAPADAPDAARPTPRAAEP